MLGLLAVFATAEYDTALCNECKEIKANFASLIQSGEKPEKEMVSSLTNLCSRLGPSYSEYCVNTVSTHVANFIEAPEYTDICFMLGFCDLEPIHFEEQASVLAFVYQFLIMTFASPVANTLIYTSKKQLKEGGTEAVLERLKQGLGGFPEPIKTSVEKALDIYVPSFFEWVNTTDFSTFQRLSVLDYDFISTFKPCEYCKHLVDGVVKFIGSDNFQNTVSDLLDSVFAILPTQIATILEPILKEYVKGYIKQLPELINNMALCPAEC